MLLDAKSCESSDHAAYKQACTSNNPMELQNLCYHSCPFVRCRAISKVDKDRLPHNILTSRLPQVLVSVLQRKDRTSDQSDKIARHLRDLYNELPANQKSDYKKYTQVWKEIIRLGHERIEAAKIKPEKGSAALG